MNGLFFSALLFGAGQFGFGVFGVLLADAFRQGIATTQAVEHARGVFHALAHAFIVGIGDGKEVERAVDGRIAPIAGLPLGRFLDLFSERRPAEVLVLDVDVLRGFAYGLQVAFGDVPLAVLLGFPGSRYPETRVPRQSPSTMPRTPDEQALAGGNTPGSPVDGHLQAVLPGPG